MLDHLSHLNEHENPLEGLQTHRLLDPPTMVCNALGLRGGDPANLHLKQFQLLQVLLA